MIQVKKLNKSFKGIAVLNNIDLFVRPQELVAYLGPNGSGKTTTIRLISGQLSPDSGSIKIADFDCRQNPLEAKKLCGLVNQHFNLDSELSIFENLDIHGRLFGMPKKDRLKAVDELLAYVELSDKISQAAKNLSGGEKRRVMFARALMHKPAVLLLDEPTTGLDPAIRRRIWALIKRLKEEGRTILLTTHYIEEAEFLADRVVFIDKGRIIKEGKPQDLINELGFWALDLQKEGDLFTYYFQAREEALNFASEQSENVSVRRVNLEDAYLKITGSKSGTS